jgi:putative SOS response-associated peptidase YedK
MCGRFVSASPPDELARYLGAEPPPRELEANYNVAPTTEVYIARAADGHRRMSTVTWGLVPFWAKDRKIGSRMINARSESVLDKPAYRNAIRRRRCLVPADGFYEWAEVSGHDRKQPYYVHRSDGEPLVFAGLWERWRPEPGGATDGGAGGDEAGRADPSGPVEGLETCAVVTCAANGIMSAIHDRMPVLLPPSAWDRWLADTDDLASLVDLLQPAPDDLLRLRPIATTVNNARNNGSHLLEPDPDPLTPLDGP